MSFREQLLLSTYERAMKNFEILIDNEAVNWEDAEPHVDQWEVAYSIGEIKNLKEKIKHEKEMAKKEKEIKILEKKIKDYEEKKGVISKIMKMSE